MFNLARAARTARTSQRLFSSSASRQHDVAKLILIGRIGKEAEAKTTQNGKEYVIYTVATTNYPPPPPNPDGSRPASRSSWHHIFSFNPASHEFIKNLPKGASVYVEANYELREGDSAAEPNSHQAQKQIFLRHENLRVLRYPANHSQSEEGESSSSS
ncbi:hypothetical protein SCHPADRAFT_945244 [Schizopora paradoxa]|uniref:Nucleic acid-binding protein n=1 Tax=Schizopora paradoxa TaxID=27342 RepID=A0A0H2RDB7_9AGAM|nr:hypothetical protein SCHPADRAFT_945244 [Schizopora paradoxa]